MKYCLFILAILSFGSLAAEPNLNTYQNNQVQQVVGQVYHIYSPELNTRVRQKPSLGSRVLALLNNDDRNHDEDINHKDYKYAPYDEEWMKVLSSSDGSLLGYSHRSLFGSDIILKYEDIVSTPEGDYKLEFAGHSYQQETEHTYGQGNYYYRVTSDDGELLIEKGWNSEKRHLKEGFIKEGEYQPIQFHTLDIQGKRVGWLFGWNQYENSDYSKDVDFSFARIIVPTSKKEGVYTNQGLGYKFRVIADLLDKQDNQLVITEGFTQDTFDAKPSYGYYYLPYQHLITLKNDGVSVEGGSIALSNRLIESNPYYAYAIAINTDDYEGMRRASDVFKDKLNVASKACPEFDLTVEEACSECREEGLFRPVAYLDIHDYNWNNLSKIQACLTEVLTEDEYYHLFYRTGLFPSQRVIDDYLENQYRYMEEFYYDYRYQKES